MPHLVRIIRLTDAGDVRGCSFTVPAATLEFLGTVRDVHVAEIDPGAVRGNHYHKQHREVLCIRYESCWSLYWDSGADTAIQQEDFSGTGLVVVEVEPLAAHAVRNGGNARIQLVGLSDLEFDPQAPDSHARRVI